MHPVHVGELPPQLAALNRTYLNVAELTVRAALEGRPGVRQAGGDARSQRRGELSLDAIWEMCDELTAAHGDACRRLRPGPKRAR